MINNNGRIVQNVSIQDVRIALTDGSYDLGTLCKSNKINKWSKYKPISVNKVGQLTAQEYANANFGLGLPIGVKSYNDVTTWVHRKPTGGISSPYRLTDFLNYEHNAPKVIRLISSLTSGEPIQGGDYDGYYYVDVSPDVEYVNQQDNVPTAYIVINQDSSLGGILPSELHINNRSLSDLYFAIRMVNMATNAVVFLGTSLSPIGSSTQSSIYLGALTNLEEGEYEVAFFLCPTSITPQANPTQQPSYGDCVTVEGGAFRLYLINNQNWYGHVLYSNHPLTVSGVNPYSSSHLLGLPQTSAVESMYFSGNNPDVRRRISIKNTNADLHFSNYDYSGAIDIDSTITNINYQQDGIFVVLCGCDGGNVYDGISFGLAYKYRGAETLSSLGSIIGYEFVYDVYVAVSVEGEIIQKELLYQTSCIRYKSSGYQNDREITYPNNGRIVEFYVSNITDTNLGAGNETIGIQVAWKLENNTINGFAINDLNLRLPTIEGYGVDVGYATNGLENGYTDDTGNGGKRYYAVNNGEAEQCNIDFEILNPVTLTNN